MQNKPKFVDPRNNQVTVYAPNGTVHAMSLTNAREMVRHSGWSMIAPAAPLPSPQSDPAVKTLATQAPTGATTPPDALSKETLRGAATFLKITFDGRANEVRLLQTIDAGVDGRLTALGDFVGAAPIEDTDSDADKAAKATAIADRRRRAYRAEAIKAEIAFPDTMAIDDLIAAFAARGK